MRPGEIGFYIVAGLVAVIVALPRSNFVAATLFVTVVAVALAIALEG